MNCAKATKKLGLKTGGLLAAAGLLCSCSRPLPAGGPISPGTVVVTTVSSCAAEGHVLPKRVYIFPPLKIDREGAVQESYTYSEDENGVLEWHAPSAGAEHIRGLLDSRLRRQGFHPVPFQTLLDDPYGHAILVITSYFTESWGTGQARTLFTRLTGSTFDRDLNPESKHDRFNQESLSLHHKDESEVAVIRAAFVHAVQKIGESGESTVIRPALK